MIYLFLVAWLWWTEPLNRISQNNRARQEAALAYQTRQYNRALMLYKYLSQPTTTIDPAVRLNLGHTYFQLKQYANARTQYTTLLESDRSDLRTMAATQLGVIACLDRDSAAALMLFRQALLENADNEPARYNFELVKKRYSGKPRLRSAYRQPAHQPQQPDRPQPASGQAERSARREELLRRFQQLNLSEEQALQLLNAMQQDDLPYALTRAARQSNTKPPAAGNRW